ncbi:1-aminocyclopropane-1-carboxylate deaminase/D-cysteine desulfhydrase [Winogradskyella eckloniae]|uniref:1-aminocyclopropane-1-carboxylate deaminase/D-cysteine desulfhydrase n=1 Tax=Winogradskyella eckloniae TaxID=1089306 RepID=UPI0015676E26|nr:pyridoxal-phosphate dependent enzyme [Winogradskyella eckloniae]NRD19434.1 1-aminocyclopropane-1-carboxylate deaminase/D-cysteine desulfhydrase [Winogradskyella eckloniae]
MCNNIKQKSIFYGETEIVVKREDLIHPIISGNKFRKLKYNIEKAKDLKIKSLLTFGGAFSNHIAALAYAGNLYGFRTIGVIRGEELRHATELNPTLTIAKSNGMKFKFVSREAYRLKSNSTFVNQLKDEFGAFYLVPEGGTNDLAIKGCEEILQLEDLKFEYVCCPVGTGGTIAGIINASNKNQKILGFPALKGDFLNQDIRKFAKQDNWELITDYHFGGYGKIKPELISFINSFKKEYNIPLDPIYTGKMMFGIFNLIDKSYFPKGSRVLVVHTGGLKGVCGINEILKRKNLPLIEI